MRTGVFELERVSAERRATGAPYREFLTVPAMSAGLYELAAGSEDAQTPHCEDEIYYVLRGRAEFSADGKTRDVGAGAVLYVQAGVEHRFQRIEEDLSLLVVFAPRESQ